MDPSSSSWRIRSANSNLRSAPDGQNYPRPGSTMAGTGALTSPPTRTYELHKECEQDSSAGLRNWDFTSLPSEPPSDSAASGASLILPERTAAAPSDSFS